MTAWLAMAALAHGARACYGFTLTTLYVAQVVPSHATLRCDQLVAAWEQAPSGTEASFVRQSLTLRAEELHCCVLAPKLVEAIIGGEDFGAAWTAREALSRMDCRGGDEALAKELRAALACEETTADPEWLVLAAGMVAGPEELSLLRDEWMRERPSACDGYVVVDTDEIAVALTFAGDDSALQWVVAMLEADMFIGWLADSAVIARATCRLPATTRLHELTRLVARMYDEELRDELVLACDDLGCWLAPDLAEHALLRREERKALEIERARAREEAEARAAEWQPEEEP